MDTASRWRGDRYVSASKIENIRKIVFVVFALYKRPACGVVVCARPIFLCHAVCRLREHGGES